MSEQDNLQDADGKKEKIIVDAEENTITEPTVKKTVETTKLEETSKPEKTTEAEEAVKTKVISLNTDAAINEIEASNAEEAEEEITPEKPTITEKEYGKLSLDELAAELESIVKQENVTTIKSLVDSIKTEFNTKHDALLEEKKAEFLSEGGNEIDFYYSSSANKRFKTAYHDFRKKQQNHYNSIKKNHQENLANRLTIIEELKGLINEGESINATYNHFKEIQEKWRNAGPIPRDKYNNAWNTYHHHVEIFYDFLHLNRDFRDLDFKHNLDKKLKIIDRAEELAKNENINYTFRELQALHKMWKEDLGPVDKKHREEIWERFKKATKVIHDKRQEYYADLDKAYEKNLKVKNDIIDKITAISSETVSSHGLWQKNIKTIDALREEFFQAGKVPTKVNEATWSRFKDSVRHFNRNKNVFYKSLKKDQHTNLDKKLELIKIAEANKESEDFEVTTQLMKKIQHDWKTIGHVPRKDSDKIWKTFKAACNHYFDRIHEKQNEENKVEIEAYTQKTKLLETLNKYEFSGKKDDDLKHILEQVNNWKTIGKVPNNKRYIEGKLYKTLDSVLEKLKIPKEEAELIKFDNKLETLKQNNNTYKLDDEHNFVKKRISELKGEIIQLENNLQFFSNANQDNPLVKDVYANIEKHKTDLSIWETKLQRIKKLYN